MSAERKYVPMIGARVLLNNFSDYAPLGLSPWTTLHVTGVDGEQVTCIRSLTAQGMTANW